MSKPVFVGFLETQPIDWTLVTAELYSCYIIVDVVLPYESLESVQTHPRLDRRLLTIAAIIFSIALRIWWCLLNATTLLTIFCCRFPFWPYARLIFNCWLVLPYFSGASYVYQRYVRPRFVNQQTVNLWYLPHDRDLLSRPDDILSAAERYIEQNGPEEFEKLINKVRIIFLKTHKRAN